MKSFILFSSNFQSIYWISSFMILGILMSVILLKNQWNIIVIEVQGPNLLMHCQISFFQPKQKVGVTMVTSSMVTSIAICNSPTQNHLSATGLASTASCSAVTVRLSMTWCKNAIYHLFHKALSSLCSEYSMIFDKSKCLYIHQVCNRLGVVLTAMLSWCQPEFLSNSDCTTSDIVTSSR